MDNVVDFSVACIRGDESEAKTLVERDPGLYNKQDKDGITGLMGALNGEHHSLCRWLLSLPGLDTSLREEYDHTALHWACIYGAPLDILITLVRLSTWETVNMKTRETLTALDLAVVRDNASAALYLSWLGAECREEFRNCYFTGQGEQLTFTKVNLQTWTEAGCQQDALYWAIAANIR